LWTAVGRPRRPRDELLLAHQDDQSAPRSGDDLFADQGPAVALDQVQLGIDLVRSIDGHVQDSRLGKRHKQKAFLLGKLCRLRGGWHAVDAEAPAPDALAQGLDEGLGSMSGTQTNPGIVAHQFQGPLDDCHARPP
jgi:hypothetical protein